MKTSIRNYGSRIFTSLSVTPPDQENAIHAPSSSHLDGERILTLTSPQGNVQHLMPLTSVHGMQLSANKQQQRRGREDVFPINQQSKLHVS